ncbi:MAG: hypothetical protein HOP11_09545 [Saprospiraceae bacterium]|nr:hypothetical protein [Saprospiraceae bacterium]
MKKIILNIFLCICSINSAYNQATNDYDLEAYPLCLIDSIGPSNLVYFTRVHSISRPGTFSDKTEAGTSYTVLGTVKPCPFQDVVKECWLKLENVDYRNYEYSASTTIDNEDFWIVDWTYVESKTVSSFANSQTPLINIGHVPLAYPYGNSQREADRFITDLKEWLDCMGICYKDDLPNGTEATPTGINSAYPALTGLRVSATVYGIEFINLYYSRNPFDYGTDVLLRSGTKTTISAIPCDIPFDLYRRVTTGAVAWGVNNKGQVQYPPYTGLLTKVSCNFLDNRRDDCNRPSGNNELWIAKVDTILCNYYISIPANENINGVWLRGINVSGSAVYQPDGGGGLGTEPQDLSDTLNDYIHATGGMGEFAVNNRNGLSYGWKITGKWLNHTLDSVSTTVPAKYYPELAGCATYKSYTVRRNELGGIVSCLDENGKRAYLPDAAIKVNPGQENTIFDCLNSNTWGSEVITVTKTFDLSKYHYFSYIVLTGTGSNVNVETKKRDGTTNNFNVEKTFGDDITAETACDYLKGTIKFTIANPGTVKISYLW